MWQRTQHLYRRRLVEAQHTNHDSGGHNGDQEPGNPLEGLEQQDRRQRARADREGGPVGFAAEDRFDDLLEIAQRPDAVDRKAEELRQLADQHRERDAVHVAVADRFRQELRDESKPHHADQDAHQPRHHGHQLHEVVPGEGIEPTLCCQNRILSPARLPVPPARPNWDADYR